MPDEYLYPSSPDDTSDFPVWRGLYEETIFPLLLRYIDPLKIAKIFDGGCGLGASTVALGRVFPESQIWACGLKDKPLPEVCAELGDRLHFAGATIRDLLSSYSEVFDLIVLARVLHHGLETAEDYRLLASKVEPRGFVLEIKDLSLRESLMRSSGFRHIQVEPPSEYETAAVAMCSLWQKT